MRKIIIISILLLTILSLSAVSAQDNTTDIESDEIQEDIGEIEIQDSSESNMEKQDLNAEIEFTHFIHKGDYHWHHMSFYNVPDDYQANAIVYIDGKFETEFDVHSDSDNLNIPREKSKTYTIKAILPETEKYNGINLTHKCVVGDTYIYIPTETMYNGEHGNDIIFYAQEGAKGTLTVKINKEVYKKVDVAKHIKGSNVNLVTVRLTDLRMGINNVEVIYSGDSKYSKFSKTGKVNVVKNNEYELRIDSIDSSYTFDEEKYFSIITSEELELLPNVTINGEQYNDIKINGYKGFRVNITNISSGTNHIVITYPGDDKFDEKTIEMTVKTEICGKYRYNTTYNNTYYSLSLPKDANGNLTIYNDTTNISKPLVNGYARIDLALNTGQYALHVNYTGDDYRIFSYLPTCYITPYIKYPAKMIEHTNETFYVEMEPSANSNVTLSIDHVEVTKQLINGKANFSLSHLNADEGEVTEGKVLRFTFTDSFGKTTEKELGGLLVLHQPKITSNGNVNMYYNDGSSYKVYPQDEYLRCVNGELQIPGEVTIKIGSKTINKTATNGVVSYIISEPPGKYNITTTYRGMSIQNKIVVKQPLSLKSVTVKKSAKKLILKATLKKGKTPMKNKKITFKFNGKTYKAKTNKKGIAQVTISKSILSKLKVGKKITYQATYIKDTVKKTAKVKK